MVDKPAQVPQTEWDAFQRTVSGFSTAKQDLFAFIRYAKDNEDWVIIFPGTPIGADKHIKNMRTCLSKFKQELMVKTKKPMKKFKMNVRGIKYNPETKSTTITLVKIRGDSQQLSEEVSLILSDMIIGQ